MKTELEDNIQTPTFAAPKKAAPPAPSHSAWDDEVPETSALKKYGVPVVVGAILATGIGFVAKSLSVKSEAPPPKVETMIVKVDVPKPTPPPVVPPPPPPQAEEKKQDMIEEVKEVEAPPDPTPQLETALKGAGNTGMVLKSGNGSGNFFGNRNTVSAEQLRWKAYAGQVTSRIKTKLETNPRKLKPGTEIVIHVWLDDTGRITRARLEGSTSDSELDAAISSEILPGLQISEPPPQGMRMPINMKITARQRI